MIDKAKDIIDNACEWLLTFIDRLHQQHRIKSPLTYQLVRIVLQAFELIDEEYYIKITDSIYLLLQLLRQPQNIDIVTELTELFAKVITVQGEISPQLCQTLVLFEGVIQYWGGNLNEAGDVLKALNGKRTADYINGQYP